MTTVKAQTRKINDLRYYRVQWDGNWYDVASPNTLKNLLSSPALSAWLINQHIDAAFGKARLAAELDAKVFRSVVRAEVRGSNAAIQYGNEAHEIAEAVLLGEPVPATSAIPGAEADAIAGHVRDLVEEFHVTPLHVEQAVVRIDEEHGPLWAGTTDLIAAIDVPGGGRVRAVLDWKSGASGIWGDAALTTGAYAVSDHVLDLDGSVSPMEPVGHAFAVWLRPQGWALMPLDISGVEETLRALRTVATWRDSESSRVGSAINRSPLRKR